LATETSSFQQLLYNIMSEPTLQVLFLSFFRSLFSMACRVFLAGIRIYHVSAPLVKFYLLNLVIHFYPNEYQAKD
ncbi:hypothetical protein, partial [Paenibacillus polysaccharolyticus]|uniref:hypothetical protein n=1 Tax=Paenibacillus polysaccharolyticus TaxID=582692 RepID=UPI001ABF63BA